ncbi:MAG: type II secretion system protein [Selenomonas sp.]|jgi:general secretion pathway protein G|nr:type II secretion system protein [Selenomonas sp.]
MLDSKQAGFSLLGVLIAVMIIGIMATMAVPRFSSMLVTANTAKIQSDLNTLDAAIAVYQLEKGTVPSSIGDLSPYISNADNLKPPAGNCRLIESGVTAIKATTYAVTADTASKTANEGVRATCDGHTAEEFGNGKNTTATTP